MPACCPVPHAAYDPHVLTGLGYQPSQKPRKHVGALVEADGGRGELVDKQHFHSFPRPSGKGLEEAGADRTGEGQEKGPATFQSPGRCPSSWEG